jgi:uncharacterized protein with von Willebrand factor type A (vWA) domain
LVGGLKVKPLQHERFRARKNRAMKKTEKLVTSTTTVRLPPDLHATIKDSAARNGHSMNVEIIARLTAAPPGLTLSDISRQNVKTQKMLQRLIDTLC